MKKWFLVMISSLVNFFYHIKKSLEGRVYWRLVTSKVQDCNIDKQAKIYAPESLYKVTIGKGTYIAPKAIITITTIGNFCSIGPNFLCGWGIHPLEGITTSPVFYSTKKQAGFTFSKNDKFEERKAIEIGNDVFIGANVTVLDGVSIGDGAVIGAGAVVSKDIPPYAIAVGCPIKIIKYRFSPSLIEKLLASKWWDGDDQVLRLVEQNFNDPSGFVDLLGDSNSDDQA